MTETNNTNTLSELPLGKLQLAFQDYLMGRSRTFENAVCDGPRNSREELLAVYADAYVARITEVLGEDYQGVHTLLGDDGFIGMCRAYIAAYPSRHPSIRWAGGHMAEFLTQMEPYCGHPALADMAGFEWAMGEAFDAEDALPARDAALADIPPELWGDMTFQFHPSLRRVAVTWSVADFWKATDGGDKIPAAPPHLLEVPTPMVVWRAESTLKVHYREMPEDEARALDRAISGATFAGVCAVLGKFHDGDEAPLRAAGILKSWLAAGLIAALRTQPPQRRVR
jgi:hypothetical protein